MPQPGPAFRGAAQWPGAARPVALRGKPVDWLPEAFPVLVPGSDFKSDGNCGDAIPAGSIPVRFRQDTQKIQAVSGRLGRSNPLHNCPTQAELRR